MVGAGFSLREYRNLKVAATDIIDTPTPMRSMGQVPVVTGCCSTPVDCMKRESQGMIRLTIDSEQIEAQEGDTLLHAATRASIRIPTLCYHKKLSPIGSCRVCMVEVDGAEKPMAACTTVAAAGMVKTFNGASAGRKGL